MIKKIKNIMKNISSTNISIIGAGISGLGAARLSSFLGANIFVSDINISQNIKKQLNEDGIEFESGKHSKRCFESDLIIISPGINPKNDFIKELKEKKIPIISEIEFASWFTKSPIIAVTGTNGKSTVVEIVNHIFSTKYNSTLIGGNIGISFSTNVLNEIKNNLNNAIHILEISSFQLEKILFFKPTICCITNITEDHLDRYENKTEYFNTKLKITQNIKNPSNIIFNKDDKKLNKYFKNKTKTTPFSILSKDEKNIVHNNKIFTSNHKLLIDQEQTNLIGKHNL